MAKRPTIADLSRESGVSLATVDRVLNGRSKVREETARRVYDAAVKLGYHATGLIAQRIQEDKPEYRLGFVFHKENHSFYIQLRESFETAAREFPGARLKLQFEFAKDQSPKDFASLFEKLGRSVQAVAGTSIDHHEVTEAVRGLSAKGISCFSLFNDFAQGVRESYIGTNNVKMGRSTAWLLSKIARPGKVALFVGGHRWHGHELRETGFRSFFRQHAPEFVLLDTMVNLETRALTYEAVLGLLDRHPDLTALYSAGGGEEGAIQAIKEMRKPGEITVAFNEDTPATRSAMHEGYVAFANLTPIETIARTTIQNMVRSIQDGPSSYPRQEFLSQSYLFPELL